MSWKIVENLAQIAFILAIIEFIILLMVATYVATKNIFTEKWK